MSDKALGTLILVFSVAVLAAAFLSLFFTPDEIAIFALKVIVFALLCAIFGLLMWIGITLLTVPLPRAPTERR
jgi:hypothetical protein